MHGPWEGKGVVMEVRCGPWSTWVMVQDDDDEMPQAERLEDEHENEMLCVISGEEPA